jgi:hypothetical protein
MLMFDASNTSISSAGSGTIITSTLPIMTIGRTRSCSRETGKDAGLGMAAVAIRYSDKVRVTSQQL